MSLEEKVIQIIEHQLGLENGQVDVQKSFVEDLNADSLDLVEFTMALEHEFNIEISETEAEGLRTVGDVIRFIESKKAETGETSSSQ